MLFFFYSVFSVDISCFVLGTNYLCLELSVCWFYLEYMGMASWTVNLGNSLYRGKKYM